MLTSAFRGIPAGEIFEILHCKSTGFLKKIAKLHPKTFKNFASGGVLFKQVILEHKISIVYNSARRRRRKF